MTDDAQIHALYVIDVDATSFRLGSETVERTHDAALSDLPSYLRGDASDALALMRRRADAEGIPIEGRIAVGTPHREITHSVDREGIDLVVMAAHGRGGVRRALLGSVTERTLRSTHVSVLVVDVRGGESETA